MRELFSSKAPKIAVIGDLMLDVYHEGKCLRISPEAPVPVLLLQDSKQLLGGAGNVACNLKALGAKVFLASLTGDDEASAFMESRLKALGIEYFLYKDKARPSTRKVRLLSGISQLLRVDSEDANPASEAAKEAISKALMARDFDAVIFSDYAKGLLDEAFCQRLLSHFKGKGILTLADPKKNFKLFKGADLITPNLKEAREFLGEIDVNNENSLKNALLFMQEKLALKYPLITLGSKGLCFFDEKGDFVQKAAQAKEVFDVTGAGDTLISALAFFMSFMGLREASLFANKAASIVVGKVGASTASLDEIFANEGKIQNVESLLPRIKGKRVVFTNGCFDLLHSGHLEYLKRAKELGDILLVAINSDRSVRNLKGPDRPINSEKDRALMLEALSFVDFVLIFDEDDPKELLSKIRPDILVKGADYQKEEVLGQEFAKELVLMPFKEGYSSSKLISKIRGENDK